MVENKLKYFITADHTDFERGMKKVIKSVEATSKAATVGFAAVGTAVAAVGAATATIVSSSAAQAKEIENLSRLAKVGTDDFRAYAYAFETVGVSQEKFADITKDLQDKLGDFIATGGGEFKDFFENIAPKVGLTADALAQLSGPDALVAVKKAMDDANVSAEEQVFYLESLANDAALLTPLLKDNGAALGEQAARARELGVALSEIENDRLVEVAKAGQEATAIFGAMKDKVSAELAPAIIEVVDEFTEWWKINNKLVTQDIAGFIKGVGNSLRDAYNWASEFNSSLDAIGNKRTILQLRDELRVANEELTKLEGKRLLGLFRGTPEEIEKVKSKVNSLMELIDDLENGRDGSVGLAFTMDEYNQALENSKKSVNDVVVETKKSTGEIQKAWEKTSFVATKSGYESFQTMSSSMQDFTNVTLEEIEAVDDSLESFFGDVETMAEEASSGMAESFSGFAGDVETSFRMTIGEGLRGEFESLGDAWESFTDNMLNAFVGTIAGMAAEWAAAEVGSWFTGGGSAASGGGIVGTVGGWVDSAVGWVGSLFAEGGVPGGSGLSAYRNTVVSEPTVFPFASGYAPSIGLMGEAGSEAIMPLTQTSVGLGVSAVVPNGNGGRDDLTPALEDNVDTIGDNIDAVDTLSGVTEVNSDDTKDNSLSLSINTAAMSGLSAKLGGFTNTVSAAMTEIADAKSEMSGWQKVGTFAATAVNPALGLAVGVGNLVANYMDKDEEDLAREQTRQDIKDTLKDLERIANDASSDQDANSASGHEGGGPAGDQSSAGDVDGGTSGLGGYASGGLVDRLFVPRGDDGLAGLKFGEGVVSKRGMAALEQINSGQVNSTPENIIVKIYGKGVEALIDKVIVSRERRGVSGRVHHAPA